MPYCDLVCPEFAGGFIQDIFSKHTTQCAGTILFFPGQSVKCCFELILKRPDNMPYPKFTGECYGMFKCIFTVTLYSFIYSNGYKFKVRPIPEYLIKYI